MRITKRTMIALTIVLALMAGVGVLTAPISTDNVVHAEVIDPPGE